MPDPNQVMHIVREFHQIPLLRILLIAGAAWLLIRLEMHGGKWLAERLGGRFRLYILPSLPILRLLIVIVAVVLVVPLIIEPTAQNLVAILGASALALGFAVKDYAASLIAGVVATYERPFRPGDWVQIGDAYGEVQSVGLRALRLVTPDDTVVTIPHLKFWSTSIYNANDGKRDLQCVTHFYLHPHHDGAAVRQKLRDVALTSPYLNLARPVVVVLGEEEWGTHYKIRAYPVDSRDQFQFMSDLTVRGKAALTEMGVKLGWRQVVKEEYGPKESSGTGSSSSPSTP